MASLVVPSRYNGPAASGNGGWSAGSLAALLVPPREAGTPVSVRLRRPVPLDVPMDVEVAGEPGRGTAVALLDGDVVMTAADVGEDLLPAAVPPVDAETAAAAETRYRGATAHPFPTCFTCGPERSEADGLRLRPGPLLWREDVTACRWSPGTWLDAGDGSVPLPAVWAALDCPGGWSVDIVGRPMVLGSITAVVARSPRVGEDCVVTGAALGGSGRKELTATSLYGADGALLARAAQIWVEVDPSTFAAPSRDHGSSARPSTRVRGGGDGCRTG